MLLQLVILSICTGSIYALMTIGLTLIFGVLGIVNFAHGEFLMLAMFATYWLTTLTNLNPYVSLIIVVPAFFLIGVLVERVLIYPITDRPFVTQICATMGLSLIMANACFIAWGPAQRTVPDPFGHLMITGGNIRLSPADLVAFIIAVIAMVVLFVFLQKTFVGKAIRAVSQNAIGAQLSGVNTKRIYALAFGIGISCVALAGTIMSPLYAITPFIGKVFSSLAFLIVVFGGTRSLVGTVVAAFIMALVETLTAAYVSVHIKDAVMYATLVVILLMKPSGLLGSRVG